MFHKLSVTLCLAAFCTGGLLSWSQVKSRRTNGQTLTVSSIFLCDEAEVNQKGSEIC